MSPPVDAPAHPTPPPMLYPIYTGALPYLTTDQMREVDRAMVEDYGIALVQMMENAGRNLAHLARARFLDGDPRGRVVVVLAGAGGNGGGALAAARRLATYGAQVHVFTTRPDDGFSGVPAHQLAALRHMAVPVGEAGALPGAPEPDVILDGVIGYGLAGAPRASAAVLIRWANGRSAPVLALDAPSGLDTTNGAIHDPTVRATATMTLALPKQGLRAPGAETVVGELYLADISVPPELYASPALGLTVPHLFAERDVIRLR